MSVARCLGLDDIDGPAMAAAAVAWQRWCHQDPVLAVVDDLLDLPDWTRRAPTTTKDPLLARLHQQAQDDAEAAAVLAWLLLPGATRLADSLRDLSPNWGTLRQHSDATAPGQTPPCATTRRTSTSSRVSPNFTPARCSSRASSFSTR